MNATLPASAPSRVKWTKPVNQDKGTGRFVSVAGAPISAPSTDRPGAPFSVIGHADGSADLHDRLGNFVAPFAAKHLAQRTADFLNA